MARTKELGIIITGEDRGATKTFKQVDDAAATTQGKLASLGEKISPAVAGAAAAVVAGVGLAMRSAFQAADESARISRETERVIRTTGASAWTTADQIGDMAQAVSNLTGADDELVQSGANMLLTFTKVKNVIGEGNDIFDQATAVALDLSVAYGTDMQSAAIQVGKALNDPIRGVTSLSRAGVQFTKEQREQIRVLTETGDVLGAQKIILGELQTQFGGAAAAAATPLDKLRVKVGNLQEDMGSLLLPVVGKLADGLSVMTDGFMGLPGPVQNVVVAVSGLAVGGAGAITVVAKLADVFGGTLAPLLGAARGAIDSAALGLGNLATKFGASQDTAAKLAGGLAAGVGPALGAVGAAAVIGFGIWSMYANAQANAEAKAKLFTDTLDKNTGALTANSYAKIEADLTDKNRLDNLVNAGITVKQYTQAIEDNTSALTAEELASKALLAIQEPGLRSALIEELREEGGVRGDLISRMLEQGTLDTGMIAQLKSNFGVYDENIEKIKLKAYETALANDQTRDEAEAAAAAAGANAQHADSIKLVADELRAQTDPYFAALRAQQQANEAQENARKINEDVTKSIKEKEAADLAAMVATQALNVDLLELSTITGQNGEGFDALNLRLQDLTKLGLDLTSQGAKNVIEDFGELGAKADEISGKSVNIPVTADTSSFVAKMRELAPQIEEMYRALGQTGIADKVARFRSILDKVQERASGGMLTNGMFVVGEQGPELGVKSGGSVRIFSNPQSARMLAGVGGGGGATYVTVNMPAGSDGEQVVEAIKRYERRNGIGWRN